MPTRDKTTGKVVVAGTSGGNANFPTLPSAGSLVIVMLSGANNTLDYAAGSVTDNQGNTYTQAVQSALNNRGRSAIFYAENIGTPSGTFTITVNTAAGTWFGTWDATSFTGMATVTLDKTTSATGTSTTPSSGATATTSQADEVVAAAMQIRFAVPGTIAVESLSPAWVEEYEELDGTNTECGESDTRIVTSTAAMTANWTASASQTWTAVIATFKATSGASAGTVGRQPQMFHPGAGVWNIARFKRSELGFGSLGPQLYLSDLTAGLTFVGAFVKQTNKTQDSTLSFIGVFAKRTGKVNTGTLSFIGSQAKQTNKALTGGLSFSGAIAKFTSRLLTGGLTFVGNIAKRTARSLSGGLSFVGNFLPSSLRQVVLTATVSFVGAFTKQTNKVQTASLNFSGAMSKFTSRNLTAGLNFSGSIAKRTLRGLSASLSFVGDIASSIVAGGGHLYTQALSATVSFSGAMGKMTKKGFTASLGTIGSGIGVAPRIILVGSKIALRLKGILYELLD